MNIVLMPVRIDPWRPGGMLGSRSLFMSQRPALAAPASDLAVAIDKAIDALSREVEAVGVESDLVSPQALRVQPEDYTQIALVGTVLSPQEIRSVVLSDARALDGVASRIQTGALSHYLSSDQSARVSAIRAALAKLVDYEQGQDLQSISQGGMTAANQHVDGHLRDPQGFVAAAEKMVVGNEAASVPVREPSEQLSKLEIIAGVGVAAGLGILLWTLLS